MRLIPLIVAALSLFISGSSFAQEWIEYASRADLFTVNFPGEPKVQSITYTTEYGITLPGHVYSYEDGPNRYSVTVVDYTGAAKIHAEQNAKCKATDAYPDICGDRSRGDLRGAIVWATSVTWLKLNVPPRGGLRTRRPGDPIWPGCTNQPKPLRTTHLSVTPSMVAGFGLFACMSGTRVAGAWNVFSKYALLDSCVTTVAPSATYVRKPPE